MQPEVIAGNRKILKHTKVYTVLLLPVFKNFANIDLLPTKGAPVNNIHENKRP
jgi:hypothetical protein